MQEKVLGFELSLLWLVMAMHISDSRYGVVSIGILPAVIKDDTLD